MSGMTHKGSSESFSIIRVKSERDLEQWVPGLCRLLQSCVNTDPATSSLGFRAPLSAAKATAYWESLSGQLPGSEPTTTLFVAARASRPDPEVIGTFQLATQTKETHAHKAEVRKLLVAAGERGHGLGRMLMATAERFASETLGKTLLLLDTTTESPARAFYLRLGYTEWGVCPNYAGSAIGELHDVSFFHKILDASNEDEESRTAARKLLEMERKRGVPESAQLSSVVEYKPYFSTSQPLVLAIDLDSVSLPKSPPSRWVFSDTKPASPAPSLPLNPVKNPNHVPISSQILPLDMSLTLATSRPPSVSRFNVASWPLANPDSYSWVVAYKNLSPKTRLGVGVAVLAWGAAGLYLSDQAEEKYRPTPEEKAVVDKYVPKVTVVDRSKE
ncbi:acyl-CoA N-acyltransferase [Colletotrichum caudatum]|nr:acyl-CoA N-acyltransferase [Colletotrichum caudatum]